MPGTLPIKRSFVEAAAEDEAELGEVAVVDNEPKRHGQSKIVSKKGKTEDRNFMV